MAQEAAVLPEDILVEVLQRLAPHSLAASRWVCKAWRDAIDGHLRGQLLSHSVRGIFINYTGLAMSEFFSRPSTGPAICGGLDWLPCGGVKVKDHCNGLLLCTDWERDIVVNPATWRWARLPQRPPPRTPEFDHTAYLAFDHAVSPHYEVYLIPGVRCVDAMSPQTEWPPASHAMHVFSSRTERWEKKTFVREGDAAGTVADMASSCPWGAEKYRAVYWLGALYIHGQCDFVMRMCLSNSTYQVIKMPEPQGFDSMHHLGRSMEGVYCAISYGSYGLELWYLDESCGQIEWVLKHDREFHLRGDYGTHHQMDKHWILQDVNYRKWYARRKYGDYKAKYGDYKAPVEEKYEWNSDDDNIIMDSEHAVQETWRSGYVDFLGFHPYKEVVFLIVSDKAFSYDWNTSKFQYLGGTLPTNYVELVLHCKGIDTYFPYTPCWMHEFPRINSESQTEDEQLPGKSLETQLEDDLHDVAHE